MSEKFVPKSSGGESVNVQKGFEGVPHDKYGNPLYMPFEHQDYDLQEKEARVITKYGEERFLPLKESVCRKLNFSGHD